jgi:hypothetical protein
MIFKNNNNNNNMNKLILITGSDYRYLPSIGRYIDSINNNSNFDKNYLVYLKDDQDLQTDYNRVKISTVNIDEIESLTSIRCLQHGEFLKSNLMHEIEDNDVIFFTDGDVFLQRGMDDDEINFLRKISDDEIYVGYNASKTDNLHDEYYRLTPNQNKVDFLEGINLSSHKVYNTGIVAMNKKTWSKVCKSYNVKFDQINNKFEHYAKQQWLLSLIFTTEGYNIIEMDYDIHNHNIYGIVPGTTYRDNSVYFNNKKCLFRHKHF